MIREKFRDFQVIINREFGRIEIVERRTERIPFAQYGHADQACLFAFQDQHFEQHTFVVAWFSPLRVQGFNA
jgi:hypothetical protein